MTPTHWCPNTNTRTSTWSPIDFPEIEICSACAMLHTGDHKHTELKDLKLDKEIDGQERP